MIEAFTWQATLTAIYLLAVFATVRLFKNAPCPLQLITLCVFAAGFVGLAAAHLMSAIHVLPWAWAVDLRDLTAGWRGVRRDAYEIVAIAGILYVGRTWINEHLWQLRWAKSRKPAA